MSEPNKESTTRIQVLTGADGKIIGTARTHRYSDMQFQIEPGHGETVHDLEVPFALTQLDADALHERLADYLPKPQTDSREKNR